MRPCTRANLRVSRGRALGTGSAREVAARVSLTCDGARGQETVTVTILCGNEAIFMDTASDSPLLKSPEFLQPISDVRRGFFAYFKPMAEALTR